MANKIKLTYFDAKGRGELSRLILAHASVPYEDNRISMEEWHTTLKAKMPLNVIPVLEYDGVILSQSKTIARFLAKEFGIAGKTNLEQAQADMIVDCVVDVEIARYKYVWCPDPAVKEKEQEKFATEILPRFLKQMLTIFKEGSGKFMVGEELTWSDIAITNYLEMVLPENDGFDMTQFVPLTDLMNSVFETPNIKKYLATRPKTVM